MTKRLLKFLNVVLFTVLVLVFSALVVPWDDDTVDSDLIYERL